MKLIPAFLRGNLMSSDGNVAAIFKTYDNGGDKKLIFEGSSEKWKAFKNFLKVTCLDDGFDGKGVILMVSDEGTILAASDPLETKIFSFT